MKPTQTLKQKTRSVVDQKQPRAKQTNKQTNKPFVQRLVAEGLELVSVFLPELLGSLGRLRHVGLTGQRSLNHLLRKKNKKNKNHR